MDFADNIDILEEIEPDEGLSYDQQDALEAAKDAIACVASLHTALKANGAQLPEEVDVNLIETTMDSFVCELQAAVFMLVSFSGVEGRLRKIAGELKDAVDQGNKTLDPQAILGYLNLANRIEKSRAVFADLDKKAS